ncbi:hypothetical protein AGMMS49975_23070 [Clostridia bacterium]|nr:hypothetical protein AGMMS49975_23070 [Clostridia bacterium]
MCEYGFIESTDYLLVSEISETNNPKNPTTVRTDRANNQHGDGIEKTADKVAKLDLGSEDADLRNSEITPCVRNGHEFITVVS